MSTKTWIIVAIGGAILLDLLFVWFYRYRGLRRSNSRNARGFQGGMQKKSQHQSRSSHKAGNERSGLFFGDVLSRENLRTLAGLFIISLSVGIFILGQIWIVRPIYVQSALSRQLDGFFQLDIHNLDNAIIGAILLCCSATLLYFIFRHVDIGNRSSSNDLEDFVFRLTNTSKWLPFALLGSLAFVLLLWRLSQSKIDLIDAVFWGISISLFVIAAIKWDRGNKTSLNIHISNSDVIALLFLLILGFLIGAYQLQEIPNMLMGDEGGFYETANAIAHGSYKPSPFDFGVFSFPVLSSFWQAMILRLFGSGLWGWRFSALIPSVLSLVPLYFLARDLFGKLIAFIASLILVTLPYSLAFARLGYNNSQSILIVALCIWFLFLGLNKASALYLFLAGAASGLGFLTYTAGRIGVVIIVTFFIVSLLKPSFTRKQKRNLLLATVPIMIGWILLAFPHLVFGYQRGAGMLREKMLESVFFQLDYVKTYFGENLDLSNYQIVLIDKHQLLYDPLLYIRLIGRGLIRTLLVFFHDGLISEHFITGSLLVPITAFFFSCGLIYLLRQIRHSGHLLIFIWLICTLLFLSVINTYPPRHQHLVPLIPVVALFTGIGVVAFSELMLSWLRLNTKWMNLLRLGIIGAVTIIICFSGLQNYFVEMPRVYRPNLENYVNWYALENSSNTSFLYLYDDPEFKDWRPSLFRNILHDVEYRSVEANEVLRSQLVSFGSNDVFTGKSGIPLRNNLVVFFSNWNGEKIISTLISEFPRARLVAVIAPDYWHSGYVIIQGDLNLPLPAFFSEGIRAECSTPVIWLVAPLLILLIYVISKEFRVWFRSRSERSGSWDNPV